GVVLGLIAVVALLLDIVDDPVAAAGRGCAAQHLDGQLVATVDGRAAVARAAVVAVEGVVGGQGPVGERVVAGSAAVAAVDLADHDLADQRVVPAVVAVDELVARAQPPADWAQGLAVLFAGGVVGIVAHDHVAAGAGREVHGAVLARDDVGQAGVGAGVVVDVVAVVALLDALVHEAVAAKGGHARGRAGVVVEQVAVVALLDALVHEAVTADVLGADLRQAGVAVVLAAVVAVLAAALEVAVADSAALSAGDAVGAVAVVAVVALLEALVRVAVAAGGDLAVGRARARGRVVRAEVALLAVADHTVATARLAVAVTAEVA